MSGGIAIFDMDGTLIGVDSDFTWKRFAVARGLADASALAEAEKFMSEYDAGKLDFAEFLRFQWREFSGRTVAEVETLCQAHFDGMVRGACRVKAVEEVERCRRAGLELWIVTSTCSCIARPVADFFGIDRLFGAEIGVADGRYTGRLQGIFPCGEGKVAAAKKIAAAAGLTIADVRAYGDSVNDLPLLLAAGQGFAVNPSPALMRAAGGRLTVLNWEEKA